MFIEGQLLHIHCGDSSAESLRASSIGGKVIAWYDPLIEGPSPAGVLPSEWVRLRAQNLLSYFQTEEDAARAIVSMDERLQEYRDFDEVVLWFDACLFDQTILIRHLDWFAQQDLGKTRLSLICISEFPGHPKFLGLGELQPTELASLIEIRHEVTAVETALAIAAWAAYRASEPTAIEEILRGSTAALPYLRSAFLHHLERFPSCRNGLERLEQVALMAISTGQQSLWGIMRAASEYIVPAYFGDTYLFSLLESLTAGPRPLLIESGLEPYRHLHQREWPLDKAVYSLTDDGIMVMNGQDDWITLQGGIDRWLGGVHLLGVNSPWRWDEEQRFLVRRKSTRYPCGN